MNMPLVFAKQFLASCTRHTEAVAGGTEIHWRRDKREVAWALFSNDDSAAITMAYVTVNETKKFEKTLFQDKEAESLLHLGSEPIEQPKPDAGDPNTWDDTRGNLFTREEE